MKNKYVDFISDEHFLNCIATLHKSYLKAKKGMTEKKFFENKVDTFKLTFDSKFNGLDEGKLIGDEVSRQIDKSVNNSIGNFHEEILSGIEGYEVGKKSGYDIKAKNNTLFAEIKNKHNTANSSAAESLYQKLARYANDFKQAKCYWVQILAKDSFNELWTGEINGKEYTHSRVYKISGDQFYYLLTGNPNSFFQLYQALPKAIADYLKTVEGNKKLPADSVLTEIKGKAESAERSILDQITFENYSYYLGFDKL